MDLKILSAVIKADGTEAEIESVAMREHYTAQSDWVLTGLETNAKIAYSVVSAVIILARHVDPALEMRTPINPVVMHLSAMGKPGRCVICSDPT